MLQSVIPRLLGFIPASWRRAVIGQPANPSRVSTFAHNLLNRLSPGKAQAFSCQGILDGYRMYIDWNRFRGFVYGTWEPDVASAVTSKVKPGMMVADIGAHIGYYTLLLAKCVGPSGRVFSFEPSPANFDFLEKNVRVNTLQNVQLFAQALYSRSEEITINVPEDIHHSGDASVRHIDRSTQLRVKAITLDSFCTLSRFRPDFLKMDVEGAEYDVLMGGQEVIAQARPRMLIELHHFDGNVDAHPVPDLLAQWGYEIEWIDRWDMTSHILATPGSATSPSP